MLGRIKAHLPTPAKRILKGALRRSHPYLPAPMAMRVERAMPSLRKGPASPAPAPPAPPAPVVTPPPQADLGSAPAGNPLGITPEHVGATYEPTEVLPMLALENTMLRTRLLTVAQQVRELQAAAADQTAPEQQEAQAHARMAVTEYLKQQPDAGGKPRHLVIANEYPDVGREYGNGFVHRRVKRYLAAGAHVDVVLAGYSTVERSYEFDGVRVLSGKGAEIAELLQSVDYTSVSVHFLNRWMWDRLVPYLERINLHVFLHGYECSRWIRTVYNLQSGTLLERAINRTFDLQQLWHEVVNHPHGPSSFIFVSDWWRKAVMDDMGVVFPAARTRVIHNIVDTDLFRYREKDADQRFDLLWVRSAANRKYGHDLAIETIKRLTSSPHWERAKVTIIGDGQHFPDFAAALGEFPNVTIEQRFASQEEIAQLHQSHGIFLVPSRLDAQGVSRDEAMSSGLVAVTNLVTAIPEFIDGDTGIVGEAERADQLAEGILALWDDPDRFLRLSKAGAERVRAQCGPQATVDREIELLKLAPSREV